MRLTQLKNHLPFITLLLVWNCSPRPATVKFVVAVPPGTDRVTITGNVESLGAWNPALHGLERIDSLHYQYILETKTGQELEYKFTRGSWITEALDSSGHLPKNSLLTVTGDLVIRHSIPGWRDNGYSPGCGITGTVRYHNVYSPQLDNTRDVIVWLPPSYTENDNKQYPVLYMHDGQNIIDSYTGFQGLEWKVDEVATALIDSGLIREIIIVGIYCTEDRTAEYSPLGKGRQYSDFLIATVMPLVDSTYRTLSGPSNTAVMGSSMGGIISFHLAWEHPDVFGMAGCLSPAFLVDRREIVKRVRRYDGPNKSLKLYIDKGSVGLEKRLQPAINKMMPLLKKHGFKAGKDLIYYIAEGAEHNEDAWAQRIHIPLKFFFGTDN